MESTREKPSILRKTASFIDVVSPVYLRPAPTRFLERVIADLFSPGGGPKSIIVARREERLQRMVPDGRGGVVQRTNNNRRLLLARK